MKGFRLAEALLDPAPTPPCDHARALDRYGTACRMLGDLEAADEAYAEANGLCRCSCCWWDRLRRVSYLRADQGTIEAARKIAERSINVAPGLAKKGRCRIAAAYVQAVAREDVGAIETARQAIRELERSDLLFLGGAVTTIGACARRIYPPPEELLRQTREELRALRRRWPRHPPYRSARGKTTLVIVHLGYRLGEVDACDFRASLMRAQSLHVELGMWRDAVQIIAEAAEICAEMRREELVARMIETMLDALPSSLPLRVTLAVRRLRKSLGAVNRDEVSRAAAGLRQALILQPPPTWA